MPGWAARFRALTPLGWGAGRARRLRMAVMLAVTVAAGGWLWAQRVRSTAAVPGPGPGSTPASVARVIDAARAPVPPASAEPTAPTAAGVSGNPLGGPTFWAPLSVPAASAVPDPFQGAAADGQSLKQLEHNVKRAEQRLKLLAIEQQIRILERPPEGAEPRGGVSSRPAFGPAAPPPQLAVQSPALAALPPPPFIAPPVLAEAEPREPEWPRVKMIAGEDPERVAWLESRGHTVRVGVHTRLDAFVVEAIEADAVTLRDPRSGRTARLGLALALDGRRRESGPDQTVTTGGLGARGPWPGQGPSAAPVPGPVPPGVPSQLPAPLGPGVFR